jgi:hypothetical protein
MRKLKRSVIHEYANMLAKKKLKGQNYSRLRLWVVTKLIAFQVKEELEELTKKHQKDRPARRMTGL